MNYKRYFVLTIVLFTLFGCSAVNNTGRVELGEDTTKNTTAENTDGFIPVTKLTENEIDDLWQVVIDQCYEINYSVTFNDRKTKNISCQAQTEGNQSTYTLRVKFNDKGIQIDSKSNSVANFMFGGVATNMDKKSMQSALETRLKQMNRTVSNSSESDTVKDNNSKKTKIDKSIIYNAQEQLSKLNYNPGGVDGSMGKKTAKAIMNFQKDNNLIVNGNLDEATLNKLKELSL